METDTLSRRLRHAKPNPAGRPNRAPKHIAITEADFLIFEAIARHGPLPSHYLYEFTKHLRKDMSHLQNRLTEFFNGDDTGSLLVRPPQQFSSFAARYQHLVYDLAPRARVALAERSSLCRVFPRRTDPFLHQFMQACVGASLELTAPSKGLRYISRNEILTHPRCPETTKEANNPLALPLPITDHRSLIPDDLFGFQYPNGRYRFFAVEIDRNTESIERKDVFQNSFGRKVINYMQILNTKAYERWWGIPTLTILTVTTNATHAENIAAFVRKQKESRYDGRFVIAVEPVFGANWSVPKTVLSNLLDGPIMTAGAPKDLTEV